MKSTIGKFVVKHQLWRSFSCLRRRQIVSRMSESWIHHVIKAAEARKLTAWLAVFSDMYRGSYALTHSRHLWRGARCCSMEPRSMFIANSLFRDLKWHKDLFFCIPR